MIFQKLTKYTVFLISDGLIKRKRLPAHFKNDSGVLNRQPTTLTDFFSSRFATNLLDKFTSDLAYLVHGINHVDRYTDGSALVGNGTSDGLAYPPSCIGTEFVTASVLELIDSSHQSRITFLNQIKKRESSISIFLSDRDNQPQVTSGKNSLGRIIVFAKTVTLGDPSAECDWRLVGQTHQITQFATQFVA